MKSAPRASRVVAIGKSTLTRRRLTGQEKFRAIPDASRHADTTRRRQLRDPSPPPGRPTYLAERWLVIVTTDKESRRLLVAGSVLATPLAHDVRRTAVHRPDPPVPPNP